MAGSNTDVRGLDELLDLLGRMSEKKLNRSLKVARIRTTTSIKAKAAKDLSNHLYLPSKAIKSSMLLKFPRFDSDETKLTISGFPLPIKVGNPGVYKGRGFYGAKNTHKNVGVKYDRKGKLIKWWFGVRVRVRKDKGPEKFRHAFTSKSGNILIKKWGAEQKKYKRMYGPAIPAALAENPGMLDRLVLHGAEKYLKQIDAQINRVLRGN